MIKSIITTMFAVSLFAVNVYAQAPIKGIWTTGKNNTKIEISLNKLSWEGKVISSDNSKATAGKLMLKNLKKDGDTWTGNVYSFKRGSWFDVVITPKTTSLELEVTSMLGSKSLVWQRSK